MLCLDLHILQLIPGSFPRLWHFSKFYINIWGVFPIGGTRVRWRASACVVSVKAPLSLFLSERFESSSVRCRILRGAVIQVTTGKAKAKKNSLGFHRGLRTTQRIWERDEEQKEMFTALFVLLCLRPWVTSLWLSFHPPCELSWDKLPLHLPHCVRSPSLPVISSPSFFFFFFSPFPGLSFSSLLTFLSIRLVFFFPKVFSTLRPNSHSLLSSCFLLFSHSLSPHPFSVTLISPLLSYIFFPLLYISIIYSFQFQVSFIGMAM